MALDWKRYEKAKQLRDSGATYRAIGAELGVGPARAKQLVDGQERKLKRLAAEAADPSLISWHRGLKNNTAWRLEQGGINSREACQILCRDDLVVYKGIVRLPGWTEPPHPRDPKPWSCYYKELSIKMVNEVREWLGVKPFTPPPKQATSADLDRALRLLERHGYKVEPPQI